MERSKNEAEAYANDVIPRARGEAQKFCKQQKHINKKLLLASEGEASRFVSYLMNMTKQKKLLKRECILETMEKVLADIDKVIIEKNAGSGVVPYLTIT